MDVVVRHSDGKATQWFDTSEAKADAYMDVVMRHSDGRATQWSDTSEAKADAYMDVGGRATQEAKAERPQSIFRGALYSQAIA